MDDPIVDGVRRQIVQDADRAVGPAAQLVPADLQFGVPGFPLAPHADAQSACSNQLESMRLWSATSEKTGQPDRFDRGISRFDRAISSFKRAIRSFDRGI
jgi:hypothetical protein